jgi:anti-anti-sigma regulatory factor
MDTLGEGNQAGEDAVDNQGRSEREPTAREPMGSADDRGFAIYVSCWGDRWRVQVSGEVDRSGATAVVEVAEVLSVRQAPAVDLDLSEVTAIDDLGWRSALYAESLLAASGGSCRLIEPRSMVNHRTRSARQPTGHAA